MTKHVLVPIADGSEDMEVVIISDILRRAGIEVTLASVGKQRQLTFAHGLKVTADAMLSDVTTQEFDMIVLPGGLPGAEHLRDSEELTAILKAQREAQKWVAAICASPVLVLMHHGLDKDAYITCHSSCHEQLDEEYGMPNEAVVVDEHEMLITSQGPGTAMRFALTLIEELLGFDAADDVEAPLCIFEDVYDEEEITEGSCDPSN